MLPEVYSRLDDGNAFALQKFFLEGSVRLANENLAAFANHAVPRDAFSGGCGSHGSTCSTGAAGQAKSFSKAAIR